MKAFILLLLIFISTIDAQILTNPNTFKLTNIDLVVQRQLNKAKSEEFVKQLATQVKYKVSAQVFGDLFPFELENLVSNVHINDIAMQSILNKNINNNKYVTNSKANINVQVTNTPTTLNWTALGIVTPPKNQLQCGCCWAYSSIGLVESYMIQTTNTTYNLSEQYTLQCNPAGASCNGGNPAPVLQFLCSSGLLQQSDYPYDYLNTHLGICTSPTNRIFVPPNTAPVISYSQTPSQIIQLLQSGPVLTLFSINNLSAFSAYAGGVYTGCLPSSSIYDLNHALLVVGYDSNNFIIKNSWGTAWGEGGFARLPQNQNCGIGIMNVQLQTCPTGQYYSPPTSNSASGYMIYLNNIVCLPCPSACNTCTSNTSCTACLNGYYLLNGLCVSSCAPPLIISSKNCTCQSSSYPNGNTCTACGAYCINCANNTYCYKCQPGYLINLVTGACVSQCPSSTSLVNTNQCVCSLGTYSSGNVCLACSAGCVQCQNNISCYECNAIGYYVNIGMCASCLSNCLTCVSNTSCNTCINGTYLSIIDYLCYRQCPSFMVVSQGLYCNCIAGYNANNTDCAAVCSSNCASCSSTTCIQCSQGYYLNQNGNCSICNIYNCLVCSSLSVCTTCINYYYLIPPSTCYPCPSNCISCASNLICLTCDPGYSLNSSNLCTCNAGTYYFNSSCLANCPAKTVAVDNICNCISGTYYNNQGMCIACAGLCSTCASSLTCQSCVSNSILANSSCICSNGYYQNNAICSQCPTGCSTCSSINNCSTCSNNYNLFTSFCCLASSYYNYTLNSCQPCLSNCSTCFNSISCNTCKYSFAFNAMSQCSCNDGTYFSNNQCLACASQCLTCSNGVTCLTCLNNKVVVNGTCSCGTSTYYDGVNCLSCASGCASCTLTTCTSCLSGFFLNSNQQCSSCTSSCLICANSSICQTCYPNYALINNTCTYSYGASPAYYQSSVTNCVTNCQSCFLTIACFRCATGFQITPNLICIPIAIIVGSITVTPLQNALLSVSSVRSRRLQSGCAATIYYGVTYQLPFTIVNSTTNLTINTQSNVSFVNSYINIAANSTSYGSPSVSYSVSGTAPLQSATFVYNSTDCKTSISNLWSLRINQSTPYIFELDYYTAPANTSVSAYSSVFLMSYSQSANMSKYMVTFGYQCSTAPTNCLQCDATYLQCVSCAPAYLLLNGTCVGSCPNGYTTLSAICLPPSTPPVAAPNPGVQLSMTWIIVITGASVLFVATFFFIFFLCRYRKEKKALQASKIYESPSMIQPPLHSNRSIVKVKKQQIQHQPKTKSVIKSRLGKSSLTKKSRNSSAEPSPFDIEPPPLFFTNEHIDEEPVVVQSPKKRKRRIF